METGTWKVKSGLAQMLKGGVIMDVVTADQAKIAEKAGMVFLSSLIHGSDSVTATVEVDSFIVRLKPLLDETKCQKNDEDEFHKEHKRKLNWAEDFCRDYVAPKKFLEKVEKGWKNYQALVREWPYILNVLKGKLDPHIQIDS